MPPPPSTAPRRVSRAPLYVTLAGLGLAVTLVFVAARAAQAPAPAPDLTEPGTDAAPRAVTVILREYDFDPSRLRLVAGETVRFTVVNAGLEPHELVIGDDRYQRLWAHAHAAATPPAPFTTAPPATVPADDGGGGAQDGLRVIVPSGGSVSAVYRVPASVPRDAYRLACHLPGHVEEGMIGAVDVIRADASAAGASLVPSGARPGG